MADYYSNREYPDRFSSHPPGRKQLPAGRYRGVGPSGYRRPDESILDEICQRLEQHGFVDASDITVEVNRGEVVLSGTVDSRRTRRMVEAVAEGVSGVEDIFNRLLVRNPWY